jgi:pimeloyl-ACP methyl ester carboxylesterase
MKRLLFIFGIFSLLQISCSNSENKSIQMVSSIKPDSGFAKIYGLNMYYEIHGQGKPIVLVHGGGSTIQTTFGILLPLFAETNKVIAVELQAHGHTSDRDAPESFEQDADDVAGLINYLKIGKADFLGFSNGGNTCMQIAIRHPEMVNKLVIISSFYKREGMFKGFFEMMQNATLKDMPAHLKEAFMQIKNDSAALQTMFEKDRNRMLHFADWRDEDLAMIKAPALILIGDKDVVTPEHAFKMSEKIPGSRLMILPGNHGSFIGEGMKDMTNSKMPMYTTSMIREFLNQ